MRPEYFLFAAAMVLQSGAGAAEDRYECQLKCSSEQDQRYTNCRATYATKQKEECFKDSQTKSAACLKKCPASPPSNPYDEQPQPRSY